MPFVSVRLTRVCWFCNLSVRTNQEKKASHETSHRKGCGARRGNDGRPNRGSFRQRRRPGALIGHRAAWGDLRRRRGAQQNCARRPGRRQKVKARGVFYSWAAGKELPRKFGRNFAENKRPRQ